MKLLTPAAVPGLELARKPNVFQVAVLDFAHTSTVSAGVESTLPRTYWVLVVPNCVAASLSVMPPAVGFTALTYVPVRPLPEASAAVVPLVSFNRQYVLG